MNLCSLVLSVVFFTRFECSFFSLVLSVVFSLVLSVVYSLVLSVVRDQGQWGHSQREVEKLHYDKLMMVHGAANLLHSFRVQFVNTSSSLVSSVVLPTKLLHSFLVQFSLHIFITRFECSFINTSSSLVSSVVLSTHLLHSFLVQFSLHILISRFKCSLLPQYNLCQLYICMAQELLSF